MKSAIVTFAILFAAAAASIVAGVFILAGAGWALIAFGGFCAFAAAFIVRGAE